MSFSSSRREFLAGLGAVAASPLFTQHLFATVLTKSPFRIAVINDEISQDFGRACEVASGFGMKWIELRGMWDKNIIDLDAQQITESLRLLKKYDLAGVRLAVSIKGARTRLVGKFSPQAVRQLLPAPRAEP